MPRVRRSGRIPRLGPENQIGGMDPTTGTGRNRKPGTRAAELPSGCGGSISSISRLGTERRPSPGTAAASSLLRTIGWPTRASSTPGPWPGPSGDQHHRPVPRRAMNPMIIDARPPLTDPSTAATSGEAEPSAARLPRDHRHVPPILCRAVQRLPNLTLGRIGGNRRLPSLRRCRLPIRAS